MCYCHSPLFHSLLHYSPFLHLSLFCCMFLCLGVAMPSKQLSEQQPQVASAALQLQIFLSQRQQQSGPWGPCQIASLVSTPRSDGSFSSEAFGVGSLAAESHTSTFPSPAAERLSVTLICGYNTAAMATPSKAQSITETEIISDQKTFRMCLAWLRPAPKCSKRSKIRLFQPCHNLHIHSWNNFGS